MRTDRQAADHLAHRLDQQTGATGADLPVAHQREVAELEALARRIELVANTQPGAAFTARARQRLVRTIEANRPALPARTAPRLRPLKLWVASLAAVVVVCLAGTAGATYATAAALPGDVLFPAKTAIEQVALDLAPNPSARADLSLEITERRLSEGEQLAAHGRWAQAGLALESASGALDRSVRLIEGVQEARALDALAERLAALLPRVESAVALARGAPSTQLKAAAEMLTDSGLRASAAGKHLGPQHDFEFPHLDGNISPHPDKPKHTTPVEESRTSPKDKGHGSPPTHTPKKPTGAPK